MTKNYPSSPPSIERHLKWARQLLSHEQTIDADILLAHVLKRSTSWLYTWTQFELSHSQTAQFEQVVTRYRHGEPLAYILGYSVFRELTLQVSTQCLIPRSETELLVEAVLTHSKNHSTTNKKILDLGCGSGAIALSLAKEYPQGQIYAADKYQPALDLTTHNMQSLELEISLILSDWFDSITTCFDIIVCNPPYIAAEEFHGSLKYEPKTALVADNNGAAHYEHLIPQAIPHLNRDGLLIFEHGYNQQNLIEQLFLKCKYKNIFSLHDHNHLPRITGAQY